MKPCYIYKAFKNDDVLYVGISDKVGRRFSQHKSYSEWYSVQDKILVCKLPNRSLCKLYETYLIKTLQPKFNKAENNGDDFSLVSFDESSMAWENYEESAYEGNYTHKPSPKYQADYCEYNESFLSYFEANKNYLSKVEETFYGDLELTFTFDSPKVAEDFSKNTGIRFRSETYNLCTSCGWKDNKVNFNILDKSIDKEYQSELLLIRRLKTILNLKEEIL